MEKRWANERLPSALLNPVKLCDHWRCMAGLQSSSALPHLLVARQRLQAALSQIDQGFDGPSPGQPV